MARRNTKALEKTQDIEKKIQELMQQKEELLKKANEEVGAYILDKWNVDGDLERLYEVIDKLSDEANKLMKEDTSASSSSTESEEKKPEGNSVVNTSASSQTTTNQINNQQPNTVGATTY